ncbi:MAG: SUMF1/EgtB/PvdO family nonheme iron enzyme [Ruminococcus sp.]|nr:SUMF1/EgtB/PvdO family nonheme iron enzyme [Ruminococcus sp.]
MSNFADMKLAVEAISGGVNTVILDDVGMPSIMYAFGKLLRSDLVTGATGDAHHAFLVDGVEYDKVYISKYQNIAQNNRAYSLPMQDPRASVTFDTALTYCRNKGDGWGIQPISLWSAIALWCKKNGTQPHGNNNYGSDTSYSWEKGVGSYTSGSTVYRTATGSGPATWYHDHTRHGIADLNGNVWEWCAGLRLVEGELQVIPYANSILATCDMSASSDEWKCIDADGNYVDQGSDGTLHLDYISNKWCWIVGDSFTSRSDTSRNCTFANVYASDDVNDSAKILLRCLTLLPEGGDTDYSSDYFYANNGASGRFPSRGGRWGGGASAGVFYTYLSGPRSNSSAYIGFRSAYYGEL